MMVSRTVKRGKSAPSRSSEMEDSREGTKIREEAWETTFIRLRGQNGSTRALQRRRGWVTEKFGNDQVSRLETKDQGALPLPAPWDRSLGKSWVSAAGKVPAGDLHGKGRCGGEGAASLFTSSFMGRKPLAKF